MGSSDLLKTKTKQKEEKKKKRERKFSLDAFHKREILLCFALVLLCDEVGG